MFLRFFFSQNSSQNVKIVMISDKFPKYSLWGARKKEFVRRTIWPFFKKTAIALFSAPSSKMDNVELICRICLSGSIYSGEDIDRLLIDIFPRDQDDSGFPAVDAFRDICGLEVSETDLLPKKLCSICYSKLEEAFRLRDQSRKSEQILNQILTKAIESGQYEEEKGNEEVLYEVERLDELELETEVKVEQPEVCLIICCGCDASFATENELRKHAGQRHRPKVPVSGIPAGRKACNICFKVFDKKKLKSHREGRNNVKPLNCCKYCGCKFVSQNGLTNHQKKFHADNLFRCCGCDFSSSKQFQLRAHAKNHEREFILNGRPTQGHKYSCKLCLAHFKTIAQKRHHERFPYRQLKNPPQNVNPEDSPTVHLCCGCPKVFTSNQELLNHQQQIHLPERNKSPSSTKRFECSGCYRKFPKNAFLNQHLQRAARKKLFACGKCSVTRRTLKELMEHEATHTGKTAFICCGCRKGFGSREDLMRHSQEVHAGRPKVYFNDEEDTERPFKCEVCFRSYKSAPDLRNHQRLVYYEKVHLCELCGKGFAQERTLAIHLATHKSLPEFPCPTCGKKYKHESQVRSCITRHERSTPKQHRCKICNVTFRAVSNLYSHMVSHSDERRYKCEVCGQSFKRSFHLRKHQSTHTGVRNFACRHCPSRFSSTTELYKHEILHTGQYPYQCEVCQKQLAKRQPFIKHCESHVEDADKVHQCTLCSERFSRDYFLSNHIKYTHRIEPQDKDWNEKFNRLAPPNRLKGGVRKAGVLLGGGASASGDLQNQGEGIEKEKETYELLGDEQMDGDYF